MKTAPRLSSRCDVAADAGSRDLPGGQLTGGASHDPLGAARLSISVTIPGEPKGKQRARVTSRGAFTPTATRNAEAWVKHCIVDQVGTPRLAGPLAITVQVVKPIPKSWRKADQTAARAGHLLPTGKPDWDNLAKLVCDAANGLLWQDDSQVVDARVFKVYGDEPRTVLTVKAI